jgi:hypothetical protein
MHETLPIISAARRLQARKERRRHAPSAVEAVTPIETAGAPLLDEFERDVHAVRDSIFALADAALHCVPHQHTQLHVSLQVIANELGQLERMLVNAREAMPDAGSRAS